MFFSKWPAILPDLPTPNEHSENAGFLMDAPAPIKAVRKHIQRPHRPHRRAGNADALYLKSPPGVTGADEGNSLKGDHYVAYRTPAYAAAANPYRRAALHVDWSAYPEIATSSHGTFAFFQAEDSRARLCSRPRQISNRPRARVYRRILRAEVVAVVEIFAGRGFQLHTREDFKANIAAQTNRPREKNPAR